LDKIEYHRGIFVAVNKGPHTYANTLVNGRKH
jgi:hypothetical protein